ncbi:hypothetical protein JHK82_027767 [Glycine max]|uniref:Reverse transcriptase zinc-binding domain-containing protein n=1 Tax=Glycine soja TaxID=3848 RepID=A0A0B2QJT3_GLYSO|nr:hypothetical protein JHK82_027767 [Glycine max]KHN20148.1 hypothetical protein glysoja_049257 [Glycine soja]
MPNGSFVRSTSVWWKDIMAIDEGDGWFHRNVVRRIGDGRNTFFWLARWVGESCLRDQLPCIFRISSKLNASVGDMGEWLVSRWS